MSFFEMRRVCRMPTRILAPGKLLSTYDSDSKYVHIHDATTAVWEALNPLLRNNEVEHLFLEYSYATRQDGVAQALCESHSLKSIILKSMSFQGLSLAYMINMLSARHPNLIKLTVRNYTSKELFPSSDGKITDALVNRLENRLNDPSTLRELQLEHITIDEEHDAAFADFCNALERTQTLTFLRLVKVTLSKASTERLKKALLKNQGITTVSVLDLNLETALIDVIREKPAEPVIEYRQFKGS